MQTLGVSLRYVDGFGDRRERHAVDVLQEDYSTVYWFFHLSYCADNLGFDGQLLVDQLVDFPVQFDESVVLVRIVRRLDWIAVNLRRDRDKLLTFPVPGLQQGIDFPVNPQGA